LDLFGEGRGRGAEGDKINSGLCALPRLFLSSEPQPGTPPESEIAGRWQSSETKASRRCKADEVEDEAGLAGGGGRGAEKKKKKKKRSWLVAR
jgi:hypothetical protein